VMWNVCLFVRFVGFFWWSEGLKDKKILYCLITITQHITHMVPCLQSHSISHTWYHVYNHTTYHTHGTMITITQHITHMIPWVQSHNISHT